MTTAPAPARADDDAPATPGVLRAARVVLHVAFAGLLTLGAVQALVDSSRSPGSGAVPDVVVLCLSGLLAAVYLAGTVREHLAVRGRRPEVPRPLAVAWLAMVCSLWIGAVLAYPQLSWAVFPLLFAVLAVLPGPLGPAGVAVLTGVVIAAQSRAGALGAGAVVGPVIGALFAVAVWHVYRALLHDALRQRRLVAELQVARAELAHRQRLAGREEERDRLAREIHDTLAQGLSSILLISRAAQDSLGRGQTERTAEQLGVLERTAAADLAEARGFLTALSTPRLAAGLSEAVTDLASEAQRRAESTGSGLLWSVRVEGEPAAAPTVAELALLRAAQASISNVERHARASHGTITLAYWPDEITLDIVDDGTGFDPAAVRTRHDTGGHGLPALRERLEAVGAQVSVESAPGAGTAVAVRLPLTEQP